MDQFDQLLTCAICLDRYRNPKLLPCQHSFCMEPCMEGLVDYVRRQVKCPECRAEHRIPYQGVQAFPTNVTLQRFLELHIDLTGEIPDPTTNQIMERCQVCSEKAYLLICAHCEKKVCTECKEAHMDVLKREISRISHQVRRVLHRLEDASSLAEKNSLLLQQNSLSVIEEIDDIYRRLAKALKDRSEQMKHEVERYLQTELKNLQLFKYNIEQELGNIASNCDLADKYMHAETGNSSVWDDCELMDTKDIFLKTMEFIRAFEYEPGDYARRVRFLMSTDPNSLAVTLATFGDLHLPPSNPNFNWNATGSGTGSSSSNQLGIHPSPLQSSQSSSGLMRSKSDHRLASQYRGQEYNDEPGGGRGSPGFGGSNRKFGERKEVRPYGMDLDLPPLDLPLPPDRKSRFRSRFTRHLVDSFDDSSADPTGRGVRFTDRENEAIAAARKERERVLDTEDVARGPLSGITRLLDSPRVIQRVQESEAGPKPPKVVIPPPAAPVTVNVSAQPPPAPWRGTSRQLSEDDDISKQKKANKETAAAAALTPAAAATPKTPTPPVRRQTSSEPTRTRTSSESTNTSTSTTTPELSPGVGVINENSSPTPTTETNNNSPAQPKDAPLTANETANSRLTRKLSPERYLPKNTRSESSDSGTSETSSASSSARNTGAAFTTEEVRQRFLGKAGCPPTTLNSNSSGRSTLLSPTLRKEMITPVSGYTSGGGGTGTISGGGTQSTTPAAATTPASKGSTGVGGRQNFQSRFLGRQTPTAEAKVEDDESSSSSSSSEEETESESEEEVVKKKSPEKLSKMEKTDIGPLLARSAIERQRNSSRENSSTNAYTPKEPPTSVSAYRRNRDAVSRVTSPPERELSRYSSTTNSSSAGGTGSGGGGTGNTNSSSNYGRYNSRSGDYGSGALTRSRSTVYSPPEETTSSVPSSRYSSGLTNKYLNRSRHTFDDEPSTPTTPRSYSTATTSSPSSSSYGGHSHRPSYLSKQDQESQNASSKRSSSSKEKDKKGSSKVSKSKSSHDVISGISPSRRSRTLSFEDEDFHDDGLTNPGSSASNRSASAHRRRKSSISGGVGAEGPDETLLSGAGGGTDNNNSSLSSWARYLKNKYGKGQSKSFERSASVDDENLSSGAASVLASQRPKRHSFSTPGCPYMSKSKVQFKFGSRGSEPGKLTWPRGICCSDGPDGTVRIVVADSTNHRICVFDETGNFVKEFGIYGNGPGEFDCPGAVWVNRIGQFIVSDRYNHRIQVFDPSGRFLRAFGSQGEAPGKFSYPLGVTTDALNFIYVCEESRVQVFQSDGTFVGKFGTLGSKVGELSHPHYIAVTNTNKVVVSDTNNSRIQIFDVNGKVLSCFGEEGSDYGCFKCPRGVAVDESGYIIIGDSGNNRIQVFSPDGIFIKAFGSWASGDQEFKGLEGLACANGNIYAVDRVNHSVSVL